MKLRLAVCLAALAFAACSPAPDTTAEAPAGGVPSAKRMALPDCATVEAKDEGDLGWKHPDCRLVFPEPSGLAIEARYAPAEDDSTEVTVQVVQTDDKTIQEFKERMGNTFNGPALVDFDKDGKVELRDANSDLGGTMRLGAQPADVIPGTQVERIYGNRVINERHRHRYEVNNHYLPRIEAAGLVVSARAGVKNSKDVKGGGETLCEMVELPSHPWFIGCQFHPEFSSSPRDGHPLFRSFVEAALAHQKGASAQPLSAVA